MSKEVAGIDLEALKPSVTGALKAYEALSGGRIRFGADELSDFEITPDKPNSARIVTTATWLGESAVGDAYIIVFILGDGTGDQKTHILDELEVERPYPRAPKIVPRDKGGTISEVHMPLVQVRLGDEHARPAKFGGTLDLLGLNGNTVKKFGVLGQRPGSQPGDILRPLATRTVGSRPSQEGGYERFGDPHAVFNSLPDYLQVAAFWAFTEQTAQELTEQTGRRAADLTAYLLPRDPDDPHRL